MLITGSYSRGYEDSEPKKYDDEDLLRITEGLLKKLDIINKPVIVKCPACGQWAAEKTACKNCGHPVGE